MGGRGGLVMLIGLGRGMCASAAAWASVSEGGFFTAGAAGYSGTSWTISALWTRKWTRGEFLTAMLRARRISWARLKSMVLRTRALMTSMREAWMPSSSSIRAMGWRRDFGGVRTPRIMR